VQGATVLVVDDDPDIRDLLEQLLLDEGYRPVLAADGREAIQQLGSNGPLPDMMLLDLLMPDTDGYQVLEHLRQNLLQEFPVLIFSAQRPDQRVLSALDSELRDFVAKPFELEEVLIRMQRLMRRSPRSAGSRAGLVRIYTLGSLRVFRDDALLFDESWRNKPAKTIFKLLFTHRGQRYPKDVIAEELWPETDPDAAANRLRVAIHELRKMLGDGARQEKGGTFIGQQEGAYYFNVESPYWSDVDAFERFVASGHETTEQGNDEAALHAYQSAEALYQGDYLRDDPFLEWTISIRERLRETHLGMLSAVARISAARGDQDAAASFCRKILRVEPWREEVYRKLMEYLAESGRPNEALRVFEECRRALQAEVEAGPSPETVQLRERIASTRSRAVAGTS
jgi:DNA-binding response OmpR family regulator